MVGLLAIVVAAGDVVRPRRAAIHPACSICRWRPWRSCFVLKIAASVVSLGSGFRGGLFFSSLLIGALGGHLLADALTMIWPARRFRYQCLCGDRHERACRPR